MRGRAWNGGLSCAHGSASWPEGSARCVMKKGSRNISSTNSLQLASAFGQATALHQAGRLSEAEEIYRRILQFQPKHFESHFLLGVICAQRGHHVDAVRQFDIAVKLNPKNASVHNSRGVAFGKLRSEEHT